ncbi:MAG: peroxiredoxin [Chthoniobacterales bacterium]
MQNLSRLPANLPVPQDDGAASHLTELSLPHILLPATSGASVDLAARTGFFVVYFYPKTGRPDVPLPKDWDVIPGARGCTPQSCAFRDHMAELKSLNAEVFGVSSQSTAYQVEAKERLHLPFELLSDERFMFRDKLQLPIFSAEGEELYRRVTLIAHSGIIKKVFYPVFPPDKNASEVINWLTENKK